MAAYDSDSSGGEETDFTSTNVLLGYAVKEPTDDDVSQLGGYPTWIDSIPPPATLARCRVCNQLMTLLLQLDADLPDHFPGHQRRLWIFACIRKTCRQKDGSIRAIRGVKMSKQVKNERKERVSSTTDSKSHEPAPPKTNIGEALFGSTASPTNNMANPFSSPSSSSTNPFAPLPPLSTLAAKPPQRPSSPDLPATFAAKASLDSSTPPPPSVPEPWPPRSDLSPAYPSYNLDADYETLSGPPTPSSSSAATAPPVGMDVEPGSSSAKEEADAFESHLDRAFQRFADRLAQNPEQVLRYEFSGTPLLYSRADGVGRALGGAAPGAKVRGESGMTRCANCGAARVFEVQLTPHAIAELEKEELSLEGMEWGTVIVGGCEADCAPRDAVPVDGGGGETLGYLEEWVGVQWEGRENRGK